jgi:hypothetical protein
VGTTWFIEGDIAQCFDKLDHGLLLNTLEEHIHDGRFINLVRELLDAGYMEEWTFHQTLSGVPQGGIVSPILANILLDKLDTYVETVLMPQYTKGDKKRENEEYTKLIKQSHYQRTKGNVEVAEQLRKQAQHLPSVDPNDPDYRRLKYVRYADDFLVGFVGPKSEAEQIKQHLRDFLREELKLELSEAKTLITHARSEAARFLGYEVTVQQEDTKRTKSRRGRKRRSVNGRIGLRVPRDVLMEKCDRYQKGGKAIHRVELMQESDFSIIATYQLEFRGIANYYRMAYNLHTLNRLKYVMEISLTKTLAHKFRVPVAKIYEKYGAELAVEGRKYKGLRVAIPRQDKQPLVATWGGISLAWDIKATLEEPSTKVYIGHSELVQRLLADYCEYCGSSQDVEVHHVRAMKHLHQYPGREKPEWVRRMIALRRKTMLLCRTCHEDVTYGRPMRRQSIKLADVKARQRAKTAILESRMR